MSETYTRVESEPENARSLHDLLSAASEITIVCHNNPDPDCLASALALGRIAADAGIDEQHILYSGTISHQQNRAFINLLEIDLTPFDPDILASQPPDGAIAFVDHAVPGSNNEVPEDIPIDIVIDHHSVESIDARFVDHREHVGATATILTEYIHHLGIEFDTTLATALMFAIRRETLGFLRGVSRAEYAAAWVLHDATGPSLLRALSSPSVTGVTIDAISEAIANRLVRGSVLISHVGRTTERDALPQAADYLATLEGIETAIVFGVVDDAVELSARSTDSRVHIGNVLRDTFGDVGSAGGHREMGGARISLGIFSECMPTDEQFIQIVETVVTRRLLAGLGLDE